MLRLAFAVSTCKVPEILILDEMIGAGDESFLKKAHARTSKLIRDVKIMVLASHDLGILKKFCNKFIQLEKGAMIKQGSIDELFKTTCST
jgi:ABC-type polysaccharide/polyol phosphate transport system ATPase subunit